MSFVNEEIKRDTKNLLSELDHNKVSAVSIMAEEADRVVTESLGNKEQISKVSENVEKALVSMKSSSQLINADMYDVITAENTVKEFIKKNNVNNVNILSEAAKEVQAEIEKGKIERG